MVSAVYNTAKLGRLSGTLWTSGNVLGVLVLDDYTFNPDHATLAAVLAVGTEAAGTSRQTLPTPAAAIDNTDDRGEYDRAQVTFPTVTVGQTARAIIWVDNTTPTNDSTRIPLIYEELPADTPSTGGAIVVNPAADVVRAE